MSFGCGTPEDLSRLLRLFKAANQGTGATTVNLRGCEKITGQTLCEVLARDAESAALIDTIDVSLMGGMGGRIPPDFGALMPSLRCLSASGCDLRGGLHRILPSQIVGGLRELDVSNNGIDDVSASLPRLSQLGKDSPSGPWNQHHTKRHPFINCSIP